MSRGFAPLCPDLVVELAGPRDEGPRGLTALPQKMAAYQRNGARLGWLLIPGERAVEVWGPLRAGAETPNGSRQLHSSPLNPGSRVCRWSWRRSGRPEARPQGAWPSVGPIDSPPALAGALEELPTPASLVPADGEAGLADLDGIDRLRQESHQPIVAYNVSGEYAMVKAAAERGWITERDVGLETLLCFERAGADLILTCHACDPAAALNLLPGFGVATCA